MEGFWCVSRIGLLLAFTSAVDKGKFPPVPRSKGTVPWTRMRSMRLPAKMEECRRFLGSHLEITYAAKMPARLVFQLDQSADVTYWDGDGLLCRGVDKVRKEVQRLFGLGPDTYVYKLEEYLHYYTNTFYYIQVPFGE